MEATPFSRSLVEKRLIRPNTYSLIFEHDQVHVFNTDDDSMNKIVTALNSAYSLGYQLSDTQDKSYTTIGKVLNPVFNFVVIEEFDDLGFPYTDMRMQSNVGMACGLNHLCPKDAKAFVDLMNQAIAFGTAHSKLKQYKNEDFTLNM